MWAFLFVLTGLTRVAEVIVMFPPIHTAAHLGIRGCDTQAPKAGHCII